MLSNGKREWEWYQYRRDVRKCGWRRTNCLFSLSFQYWLHYKTLLHPFLISIDWTTWGDHERKPILLKKILRLGVSWIPKFGIFALTASNRWIIPAALRGQKSRLRTLCEDVVYSTEQYRSYGIHAVWSNQTRSIVEPKLLEHNSWHYWPED